MAKTQGERLARLEEAYIGTREDYAEINTHLGILNGSVAENSKFRVQQQMVYWVISVAWASIFVPLALVAVALLA